jgi:hypothetical protein
LLNHHSSRANAVAAHQIADAHFHQVTASQLAIDRQIEEGAISQPPLSVQSE